MTPSQVATLERTLGFPLPAGYCTALSEHGLSGEWTDHPEFITDGDVLLAENKHFKLKPEDLSDIRSPGFIGSVKFWLIYGSGRRLIEFRRKLHKTWAQGRRFIIGNDLSELQYFIVLDDPDLKVYRYELESRRSKVVAGSLPEWLVEVKRRQTEAAVTPNRSFNRTRYGRAAWPRSAQAHHAPRDQATLPPLAR